MELDKIIGKRVVAILGTKRRKNQKVIRPSIILFDDGETFIELEQQDYYVYRDFASSARHLRVRVNKREWENVISSDKVGPANTDLLD